MADYQQVDKGNLTARQNGYVGCQAVPGVQEAVADLEAKQVTVTGNADSAALRKAIVDAGYEVVE